MHGDTTWIGEAGLGHCWRSGLNGIGGGEKVIVVENKIVNILTLQWHDG